MVICYLLLVIMLLVTMLFVFMLFVISYSLRLPKTELIWRYLNTLFVDIVFKRYKKNNIFFIICDFNPTILFKPLTLMYSFCPIGSGSLKLEFSYKFKWLSAKCTKEILFCPPQPSRNIFGTSSEGRCNDIKCKNVFTFYNQKVHFRGFRG